MDRDKGVGLAYLKGNLLQLDCEVEYSQSQDSPFESFRMVNIMTNILESGTPTLLLMKFPYLAMSQRVGLCDLPPFEHPCPTSL